MKFLFYSPLGESLSLTQTLLQEGHQVKFFIKKPKFRESGKGLVPKVLNWKKYLGWADVIVFDDVEYNTGQEIERLRKRGYLVVGGNRFGDRLENDRIFGQKIMKELGMKIPFSKRFFSFERAIKFIKENPKRYVLKFNGQLDRFLSYVGEFEDGFDVIEIIRHSQKKWSSKTKIDFILQEYIDGIEMAVGAFFNGKDFAYPINVTFEHKKFLTGGIGPLTGEMGTSMFYSKDGGKLFKETLLKMKPYLIKTNYRGFIDINSMVTEKGAYPLEFTCRFGYPQLDIQQELHKSEWGKLLYELAKGTLKSFEVWPDFAVGVVIGGAGMPYEVSYDKYGRGLPVIGIGPQNQAHIRLSEVYCKDGQIYTAAGGGYPIVVTARGKTMQKAKERAYQIVKQIVIPNAVYRIDIGDHWEKEEKRLRAWGYL